MKTLAFILHSALVYQRPTQVGQPAETAVGAAGTATAGPAGTAGPQPQGGG